MSNFDSYNASATNVQFPWPEGVTGLERILLSASGDLQRLLSAFLCSPVIVERVFAETSSRVQSASPSNPISQKRKIELKHGDETLCIAESTVIITSPECERLFLDEKYAIGQLFRRIQKPPRFCLLDVGELDSPTGNTPQKDVLKQLWRKYTLSIEGFHCEIVEVFPNRTIFRDPSPSCSTSLSSTAEISGKPQVQDYPAEPVHPLGTENRKKLDQGCQLNSQLTSQHPRGKTPLQVLLFLSIGLAFSYYILRHHISRFQAPCNCRLSSTF